MSDRCGGSERVRETSTRRRILQSLDGLPSGMTDVSAPVSIVFTDTEESTSLWEASPTGMLGKTRLAVEAARQLESTVAGRTYFADLAPLASANQVGATVAEAVGVHIEGSADVLTLVAEAITAPTLVVSGEGGPR